MQSFETANEVAQTRKVQMTARHCERRLLARLRNLLKMQQTDEMKEDSHCGFPKVSVLGWILIVDGTGRNARCYMLRQSM